MDAARVADEADAYLRSVTLPERLALFLRDELLPLVEYATDRGGPEAAHEHVLAPAAALLRQIADRLEHDIVTGGWSE